MTKGRYSSSTRIFEKRGDPWLSDKERVRDFDRQPENENPDFDFDHRFHYSKNAKGKPKTVAPHDEGPNIIRQTPKPVEGDFAQRGANILHRLRRESHAINVGNSAPIRFKPCPGCRKALCATKGVCSFPQGRKM